MSGKKTNGDLTALFRLEFYRKQNNWKFCSEVHQKVNKKVKKAPPKDKSKAPDQHVQHSDVKTLNKTFIVKTEPEGNEERSDFNNAFMESDNDKNLTTPQNSPLIPANNWSPEFIHTSDRWGPQDSQNNQIPTEQSPDNLNLTHSKIKFSKLGLYLPDPTQNWQPDEKDCNWQCQPTENWSSDVKEGQIPQDTYNQNVSHQLTFDPNWLQQQMVTYRQSCMNSINNQAEKEQKIKNAVAMQSWENIATQSNEKYQDLNNNSPLDFTPVKNIPEPILENWQEWKEKQISSNMNTLHLPEDCPDGMVWQHQYKMLPDMDKEGSKGNEADWPLQTQIWTNHKLIPENVWSDEVLRELELLNAQDVDTNIQSPGEKWVPPDRLLQWMLANKECCDDVLETSCESETRFMRAAHSVPHSSEIDIRLPTERETPLGLECGGLLTDAVDVLSEAALMAAGRAHARALHRVARELRNREQRHSTNVPAITEGQYDGSCEEYPTRDIGLYQPAFIDTFISGSHKNNPNIKTLDIPKEYDLDINFNCNQLEAGGIMVDKVDRQIKVNRGVGKSDLNMGQNVLNSGRSDVNMRQSDKNIYQSSVNIGQSGVNIGQSGVNIGQCGVNIAQSGKGQNSPNLSQTELEWNHLDLDMGQDGNNLFPNKLADNQMGITGQSCTFSDCNIIGRGRGRLPLKEAQILPGRGRGRKEAKISSHLNTFVKTQNI